MTRARRPRRTLLVGGAAGLAAVALALAGAVVAGLPVYVHPAVGPLRAADVVDVVGPPTPTRLAVAQRILDAGTARALVVTVSPVGYSPYAAADIPACTEPLPYPVHCITPDPFTTQGESRALARLADREHWTSAIVVTRTAHVTRARVIIARCFPGGRVQVVEDGSTDGVLGWARQYVYQSAGFVKYAVQALVEGRSYCG